ncbi:hypothetical protein QNH46_13960 [Paenibacillus woosongensis]|uniref:Uncharacterized protein n=1 Tax=Paenibacillus woosongensis TaxID=307580 RepID=A0AA95I3J8_9BACL|nr:hypothetical protein [Paenibacillus woosongensis]WHX47272.1 hypothetical protein QNH46_13960 [Paenibacillus woosongensis]
MIVIALVFVLIGLFEWSDWRKRHEATAKLWRPITVIAMLLLSLEAYFLAKDNWNFEETLHGLYSLLGRWL